MKEKVIIIGANEFQNRLILKAKEKGYETHVFAWECGDVGEKTADYFYPVDIRKKEIILEVAKGIRPIGIISIGSDLAVETVNYVANALYLVGNSEKSTILTTKKDRMRQAFWENGDPSPKSISLTDAERVKEFLPKEMNLPLIVKPSDRSGSRGITKITQQQQLQEAVTLALEQSLEKKAVIEEYVEGKEYSVECISFHGKHTFLALTEKFTTEAPHFIETGHFQPAEVFSEIEQKIIAVVTHALDSLQVQNGASHSEIKIDDKGTIRIIEIGARMGGDCIGSDLTPISTGMDYVGMVLDIACGKAPNFTKKSQEYAFVRFVFNEQDKKNMQEIKNEYADSFYRQSEIRMLEQAVTDSSNRYGYYIMKDKSKKRILEIIEKAYR